MDNFGINALGARAFDLDQSKMELEGAQTENAQALSGLHRAEEQQKIEALRKDKLMSQLLQSAYGVANEPEEEGSPGDPITKLGSLAFQAGLSTQGMEYMKLGSLIDVRQARAVQAKTAAAKSVLEQAKTEADLTSRFMEDVTDQDSFNEAVTMLELQTGRRSRYRGAEYSPELLGRIQQEALSSKEQADLAIRSTEQKQKENYRRERLNQIDKDRQIRNERKNAYVARQDRMAKNLGTGQSGKDKIGEPKKADLDRVRDMIRKDYPELEDTSAPAFDIASDARRLMKMNPALDIGTALGQSYMASIEAGDFKSVGGKGLLGTKTETKYGANPAGKSIQTAITATKGLKPIRGRYYRNGKGEVAVWNGKNFSPVDARTLSGNNPRTQSSAVVLDKEEDDDDRED